MSANNIELIKRIYDAFGSRNYEVVLADFAEDFEWIAAESSPLSDKSPYRGTADVRTGVFDRIAAGFDRLEVIPDELFAADGERVVALGFYHGRFRGALEDFKTQVPHIWTIKNGKAAKFQQYVDTLKVSKDAAAVAST